MNKFWWKYAVSMVLYLLAVWVMLFRVTEILPSAGIFGFFLFTMIAGIQTFIAIRFGSGVETEGERVILPTLSGKITLNRKNIEGMKITKGVLERAFDYSSIKIFLTDGGEISYFLPDPLLKDAQLAANKAG